MTKLFWLISTTFGALSLFASAKAADTDPMLQVPLEREANYSKVHETVLLPWFDNEKDQWLRGTDSSAGAIDLRYRAFVEEDNAASIVIVHGYSERIEKYRELAFDFHQQGYNVFIYDQRGSGLSTRMNELNAGGYVDKFEDYAWDLQKMVTQIVRKRAPDKPIFLFAHSMGGAVSALMVHQNPSFISAMILSAPMLEIKTDGIPNRLVEAIAGSARALGYGKNYVFGRGEPQAPDFAFAATQSRIRWQIYADFTSNPAEASKVVGGPTYSWLVEALGATSRIDSKNFAKDIQVPILLFQGESDQYVKAGGQDRFCARASNCQKIMVNGSKHEIYREQDSIRVAYMQQLFKFLQKQRQDASRLKLATP